MIGFTKLGISQVESLDIGTQVFVKMTGVGWSKEEKECDGLYYIGMGKKLWSEDCDHCHYICDMNQHCFEFEVYIPDIRYKINSIVKDINVLLSVYQVPLDDVIYKIRKAVNNAQVCRYKRMDS